MIGFRELTLGMLMLCLLTLTGCLGGGGGGSSSTSTELTSLRVSNDQQPADGVSAITLTITTRNADGTVRTGAAITLAASSDTALFSSVSGTTDATGRFVVTVTNDVAELVNVTAFVDGESSGSIQFTFVSVTTDDTSNRVSLNVTNNGQPANGSAEITLTAIARNTNGTALSGLNISFATDSDSAIFSRVSGNTDATGRFSVTVTNSVAETVAINAFTGSVLVASTQLNFITIDNRISFSIANNQQPANGTAEISLSVIARNTDGTALQSAPVELASSSDTALFSAMRGNTDANGRFTVTVTNTVEETVTVKAFVNDTSVGELQLIFLAANANSAVTGIEMVVTRNFQAANGTSSTLLTIIARDSNNFPLANVPVSLSSDSASAVFEDLNGFTEEDGRFNTTLRNTIAEVVTVTATVGDLESESVEITFVSQVDEIRLSSSDYVLAIGDTATLTATVFKSSDIFDSNSNAGVTPLPDTPVTVSVSGSAILGNVPKRTDENGQIKFTITDRNAETVVVRVTSRIITQTVELYFGASLQLVPNIVNAIGNTELTALLKDGNNRPLPTQAVTFGFANENSESLSARTINTDADGTATITVTDVASDGGRALVRASIGTLSATSEVNFRADFQGGARRLTVSQSATVLTLAQTATITATITDKNGFPIMGQLVEFSLSNPDGGNSPAQLSTLSGVSDDNGIVQTQVSSAVATNAHVTVHASTAQQVLNLYFGASLQLSPSQARGLVDTVDSITLTASLVDANQVAIAGIPLKFRLNSGEALLSNFNPMTDTQGQAEIGVRQRTSGESIVSVSADNLDSVSAQLTFVPNAAETILLSVTPIDLSVNGTASITANVLDEFGNPMPAGTRVQFSSNIGTVTPTALTDVNGSAVATFTAATQAGFVTITASSDEAKALTNLTVHPANAGIIELNSVTPQVIGISGSGTVQSSLITFRVRDNLGNPVVDGTEVRFALGSSTLGGGESISTGDEVGSNSVVGYTNSEGLVSVSLKSGKVAGNIDVVASINNISAAARVTIVGDVPDLDRLSLAAEYLNIAGGVTFGLQNTITAYVGDRFGNVVSDGTGISFITEGGTIGTSIGTGAFTTTTSFGQASAILQTANPAPPLLGGLPTLFRTENSSFSANYNCGDFTFISNASTGQSLCGNPSVSTIVAYTSGSESFIDSDGNGVFDAFIDKHSNIGYEDDNGNGRWDQGEIITERGDSSEPYIDANDNRTFDTGEFYIDVNSNGRFNGPDGLFQDNTIIWRSIRVLFSDRTAPLIVTTQNGNNPNGFQIANGASLTFVLQALSDQYGNALVGGTRFSVRASNGVLAGSTDFTFDDSVSRGFSGLTFTLASNAPSVANTDTGTVFTFPAPSSATITITVTSPSGDTGGNGAMEMSFSGTINIP